MQIIPASGTKWIEPYWRRCISKTLQMPNFIYSNFFWFIVIIKLSVTCFAFFIYSKFTPFLDAAIYLSPLNTNRGGALRTEYAHLIYRGLREILYSDLAVHLLTSFFLAYIIWYVFNRTYNFINKPLFFGALLLPHFMIWSGVVGKEALAIAGFLLVTRVCVDLTIKQRTKIAPLILGLLLISFRPHYFISYGYLLVATLLLTRCRGKMLDSPKNSMFLLLFGFLFSVLFIYIFWDNISQHLLGLMQAKKAMFLDQTGQIRTNRLDIQWQDPIDFISNLWWGLPVSIIGPTLQEAVARPLLLSAFLEGFIALGLFVFIIFKSINFAFANPKYNAVIILGLIPAILIGLLVNYPVGIFNPGSAIRYKQALAPLFYFYAILLMGEADKKSNIM